MTTLTKLLVPSFWVFEIERMNRGELVAGLIAVQGGIQRQRGRESTTVGSCALLYSLVRHGDERWECLDSVRE